MNHAVISKNTSDLASLLAELIAMQESLHAVVAIKLESMRKADVDGMLAAAHREGELTAKIGETDSRRRDLVARLCSGLGLPSTERGKPIRLSLIASRLERTSSNHLLKLAQVLRDRMLKVAEINRVVELVSREMLAHFKTLFSAMIQDGEMPGTYSAVGAVDRGASPLMLDAVG